MMVDWVPAFERVAPGLAIGVLRTVLRIAAWETSEWNATREALATHGDRG
jgi:hypothetical protein